VKLLPYDGDDGWVEDTLVAARAALMEPGPPAAGAGCEYCDYVARAAKPEGVSRGFE